MLRSILFAALLIASGPSLAMSLAEPAVPAYKIDPSHTQVLFSYNHLGFSNITGRFDGVSGTVHFDPKHVERSSVDVRIAVDSISTGVKKLDEHLLSDDFFLNEKHPEARFVSQHIEPKDDGSFVIHGTLELNGHSGHVALNAKINKVGVHPMRKIQAAGFDASGTFLRSAFGLGGYVPNVGDDVTLHITVEALADAP